MDTGDQGTRPTGRTWRDTLLRRGARGRVALPFLTEERSRRDQHRRLLAIVALGALAMAVANAIVLTAAGIMPGLRDPQIRGPDTTRIAAIVILAVPAGAAALLYGLLWLVTLRGVRDDDGHPWRLAVTEDAFALTRSDGTRIAGPWSRWRYEGHRFTRYRGAQLSVTALHLALDGRAIVVDLLRTRRPRRLLRAILQRLAAHGGADG